MVRGLDLRVQSGPGQILQSLKIPGDAKEGDPGDRGETLTLISEVLP